MASTEGGRGIDTAELLATIGELYVQVRLLRLMVSEQQQRQPAAPVPPNGTVQDAVHEQC